MKKKVLFQAHKYERKNAIPNTKIEYPIDKASADFMMRSVLGLLQFKIAIEAERKRGYRRLASLSNTFGFLYQLYKEKGSDDVKPSSNPKD